MLITIPVFKRLRAAGVSGTVTVEIPAGTIKFIGIYNQDAAWLCEYLSLEFDKTAVQNPLLISNEPAITLESINWEGELRIQSPMTLRLGYDQCAAGNRLRLTVLMEIEVSDS